MTVLLIIVARIAPVFLVMGVGFAAFSFRWIDEPFVRTANVITYRIALPSLIFLSVLHANFRAGLPLLEIAAFTAGLVGATLLAYLVSALVGLSRTRRASFVQGSIRGNLAIIGLAVFQQILGEKSLPQAAVYLAFFMLVHNLIGIAVLTDAQAQDRKNTSLPVQLLRTLWTSLTNPLMLAIYLGAAGSLLRISLPATIKDTLEYLRQLALPLALLGVGASLRVYYREKHLPLAAGATLIKLIAMPAIATAVGLLLRIPTVPLLMVAVFAGSPAAIATFSLADGMGADRDTAGSIILTTHVICIATIAILIALIRGGIA